MVASTIPVNTPTPIAGLRTEIGAATADTIQFSGWARDRMLKSTVVAALVQAQMVKYLRLSWKPLNTPARTIIATSITGMDQPMIFPSLDGLGTFEISERSVESFQFSRPSIVLMIPFAWPAPITATFLWPGACIMFVAR